MNTHLKTILTFIFLLIIMPSMGWVSIGVLGLEVVGSVVKSYYVAGLLTTLFIGTATLACAFIYYTVYVFWKNL